MHGMTSLHQAILKAKTMQTNENILLAEFKIVMRAYKAILQASLLEIDNKQKLLDELGTSEM